MAEIIQPGQATPAPGLNLPIPNQGIPDMGLQEAAAAVGSAQPDPSRSAALVGQMMQLAAQLATTDPIFVGPMDQFVRSIIPRLGFAARAQALPGLPGVPASLPALPPNAITGTGPLGQG